MRKVMHLNQTMLHISDLVSAFLSTLRPSPSNYLYSPLKNLKYSYYLGTDMQLMQQYILFTVSPLVSMTYL